MPTYALLLAHDDHPTSNTEWPAEPGGACDGWAEWFQRTPLLFSVMLGDARSLPELVPCSAYQDKESLSALAAPMVGVKARWQWLKAQMEPLPAHWPASLQQQWQEIDTAITHSPRQWLLLDCATLSPHDFDEPEFTAFLQGQRDQCLLWDCSTPGLPEVLQNLKQSPASELGWWSPTVIARTEVIAQQDEEDWPAWLADHYELRHHGAWEEALDACYVTPKLHPRTGKPPQNEDERCNWPIGLVTPYGRWLQRPLEDAHMAFTSGGYINVRFAEAPEGAKSGLKDLNGIWVISPSQDYKEAYAITPHVMGCKSPHAEHREDLRSLPGLELLYEAVQSIDYNPEKDNFIRASTGPQEAQATLLLNEYGKPLFDSSRYERVGDFNAKTGLAVAYVRKPYTDSHGEANSHILEGVLHVSGQEIIPCEYELIERGFTSSPPKVFPGSKLLAFTQQGHPRIYNTKGKLLAGPDIWCPPLNRSVKKNELLTFMGEGPEAEMGMFSIKDYSFTPTGETWEDYRQALKGMFKGLGGDAVATVEMQRTDVIAAEDPQWMHDVARMLCLGNTEEAAELVQQWRDCMAHSDPEALGWDEEEDEFNPEVMVISGDENALTLYWVHLLAIATQFAHIDWKDADALAGSTWLPGASDWRWDRASQGDGMEDGFDSLDAHLQTQGLALVRLRTDDDSLRYTVVRKVDAVDWMDRLAQAAVGAWMHGD